MNGAFRASNVVALLFMLAVLAAATWMLVGLGARAPAPRTGVVPELIAAASPGAAAGALSSTVTATDGSSGAGSGGGAASTTPARARPAQPGAANPQPAGSVPATGPGGATAVAPPAVDAGPFNNSQVGGTYLSSGTVTTSTPGALTGSVNYGDGTGDQPLVIHDHRFTLTHVYSAVGTYTVIVQAVDARGATGTGYTEVTVKSITLN
jgi:hypothetical protein